MRAMRTAYTISAIGHAAVLLWSVWSLSATSLPVASTEGLPVDLVTASDFSKITAGSKDAPKSETAKPLVEKVAEANPVEDPTAKVVEKKEVKAAREPPPAPEAKPAEPEPEKKQAEAPPDPIADALAKDEAKKPAPPTPKFDPKQVAALLDKRDSTRLAAAGETLNNAPSLGLSNGAAAQLSLSAFEALRARLAQLWTVPAGAKDPQELVVLIRVKLNRDGRLAAAPVVLTRRKGPLFVAARDSAVRALFRGQPYV